MKKGQYGARKNKNLNKERNNGSTLSDFLNQDEETIKKEIKKMLITTNIETKEDEALEAARILFQSDRKLLI